MGRKSHQLYSVGQPVPCTLPSPSDIVKGRVQSENLEQTSHENQGSGEGESPPNTQ